MVDERLSRERLEKAYAAIRTLQGLSYDTCRAAIEAAIDCEAPIDGEEAHFRALARKENAIASLYEIKLEGKKALAANISKAGQAYAEAGPLADRLEAAVRSLYRSPERHEIETLALLSRLAGRLPPTCNFYYAEEGPGCQRELGHEGEHAFPAAQQPTEAAAGGDGA